MTETVKRMTATPETGVPAKQEIHHPLMGLRHEVDTLFDNFFSNFSLGPFGRSGFELDPFRRLGATLTARHEMIPTMDVRETDTEIRISAELPGMDKKDIEVTLSDGILVIKGEKKEETKKEDENALLTERHYGSVYRSMHVPEVVDEANIDATFINGILTIILPKTDMPEKSAMKVEIKS